MGAYLSAHFRFLAQDALWLADEATEIAIQRSGGIQAMGARGRRFASGVRVTANAEEALAHDYDALFFVMPVYETADALYSLRKHAKKRPTVVALQRGIGGSERIASVVGAENVIRGALTTWVDSPLSTDTHEAHARSIRADAVGRNWDRPRTSPERGNRSAALRGVLSGHAWRGALDGLERTALAIAS